MRIFAGLLVVILPALCRAATPFTATEVSHGFDAPNQPAKESRFLFAMNRDGSIASVDLDPTSGRTRQIIDVVKHQNIVVNPNSKSAAIMSYGGRKPSSTGDACEQRFRSIVGAVVTVDKSAGVIQGVSVQRISVSLANNSMMEVLIAPSLDCHMIQVHTLKDGVLSENRTTENLQLGDPDRALFRIPTDYRISQAGLSNK